MALFAIAVLVVAGIGVYLKSSAEPALALPATVHPAAGSLEGRWTAGSGSVAGFRIVQTVLGMTGDVVGRTDVISGSATVGGDQVVAASFRVDLTTIRANGKRSPQFDQTLQTSTYPEATFRLTRPVALTSAFASGAALTTTAIGTFALHGVSRAVAVPITPRRDGAAIDVTGSIPVVFSEWGIQTPAGYGWLGSVADRGSAEFLLVLRSAAPAG